ncbi:MAG: hypothetical protein S4CHLAM7_04850 [Chlamydiae bacterium]|nr:hypothetical protein [Chlamydiota bacterium]
MGDKGIPPPSFSPNDGYNVPDDPYLEEETESFENLMKNQRNEEGREERDTTQQLKQKEDALKSLKQREEMNQGARLEDEEKGIEEEDSKKINEEEDQKSTEERRADALKKGKGKSSAGLEEDIDVIDDNQKIEEDGHENELENEDPLHTAKQQVDKEKAALLAPKNKSGLPVEKKPIKEPLTEKKAIKEPLPEKKAIKEPLPEKRVIKEPLNTKKTPKKELLEKHAIKKQSPKHLKPSEKKPVHKETKPVGPNQNIAANMLTPNAAQANGVTKGNLDPSTAARENQAELEKLVEKIIEEAQVVENGDEIKTTISLNLPGSTFDQGEIEVSAFKYRPLEVNLKFSKFNQKGTGLIKQNKEQLKNTLKINSLKVHQLEITE